FMNSAPTWWPWFQPLSLGVPISMKPTLSGSPWAKARPPISGRVAAAPPYCRSRRRLRMVMGLSLLTSRLSLVSARPSASAARYEGPAEAGGCARAAAGPHGNQHQHENGCKIGQRRPELGWNRGEDAGPRLAVE